MTVPSVTQGRGAWTTTGKPNGKRFYQHALPIDGLDLERDVNFEAVNLGVKAIQARVNAYLAFHGERLIPLSGRFGVQTGGSVRWVQNLLGLHADGVCGPVTCRALWRDLVTWFAATHGVPPGHLWGMMTLESAFDPGAVGVTTPSDRGLAQINLTAHPTITVAQAFDPLFAIDYSAKRLAAARQQFSGKGPDLQRDCSIASHNSPKAARTWYEVGWVGADEKIGQYVALVLKYASGF